MKRAESERTTGQENGSKVDSGAGCRAESSKTKEGGRSDGRDDKVMQVMVRKMKGAKCGSIISNEYLPFRAQLQKLIVQQGNGSK